MAKQSDDTLLEAAALIAGAILARGFMKPGDNSAKRVPNVVNNARLILEAYKRGELHSSPRRQ